jgi:hypothetical protein
MLRIAISIIAALLVSPALSQTYPAPPGPGYTYTQPWAYPGGATQSQVAVTTSAPVTLTVPVGATSMVVCVRAGSASGINYSTDGTTPTTGAAGASRQLVVGACVPYYGTAYMAAFKAIATSATTAIDVEYTR